MSLVFKPLSRSHLMHTSVLLKVCFPREKKFNTDYLRWLYIDNPRGEAIGFDCFDGKRLVAHYACIPMRAMVDGSLVDGLLSVNTATEPGYQGRGIFRKLADLTYEVGASRGFAFVCGVANANSSLLFERLLKFANLGELDALIGVGNFYTPSIVMASKSAARFYPAWDRNSIEWRANNPMNGLYKTGSVLTGHTSIGFLSVSGAFISEESKNEKPDVRCRSISKANLVLGLLPDSVKKNKFFVEIPRFLKPSPLNFIYKNLGNYKVALDRRCVFFTFIDFDAF